MLRTHPTTLCNVSHGSLDAILPPRHHSIINMIRNHGLNSERGPRFDALKLRRGSGFNIILGQRVCQ